MGQAAQPLNQAGRPLARVLQVQQPSQQGLRGQPISYQRLGVQAVFRSIGFVLLGIHLPMIFPHGLPLPLMLGLADLARLLGAAFAP